MYLLYSIYIFKILSVFYSHIVQERWDSVQKVMEQVDAVKAMSQQYDFPSNIAKWWS